MMMVMAMRMSVVVSVLHRKATSPGAKRVTVNAVFDVGPRRARALSLDVVVVAFLRRADFRFKSQNLRAVLTHRTIHQVLATKDLCHSLSEGRNHLRMIVQIPCFDELNVRVLRRDFVGKTIDSINQNSGKEEVRKDDDAFKSSRVANKARPRGRSHRNTPSRPIQSPSLPRASA